jgi:hypothetical protein
MKRFFILFGMCFIFFAAPVFCQEYDEQTQDEFNQDEAPQIETSEEPEYSQEDEWQAQDEPDEGELPQIRASEEYVYKANQRGDQFIRISLMVDLPIKPSIKKLLVGGEGLLGYMYFLNSNFALGGDISFEFNSTIGEKMFTLVPIMVKFMYQPTFGKFEIPIIFGIGGVFENYLDRTYFGFGIKPEVAVLYRINASWSLGVNGGCFILPQTYSDKQYNYVGVIADVGLIARYHF